MNRKIVTVNNYAPVTREFVGVREYEQVEGVGLPANSTLKPVPESQSGYTRRFIDNDWQQVKDKEPPAPTEQELAGQRLAEIQQELDANDSASTRPLRAIVTALRKEIKPDPQDEERLEELEAQAQKLRAELTTLQAS